MKFLLCRYSHHQSIDVIDLLRPRHEKTFYIVGASAVVITNIIILVFRPMPSTCCNVLRQNCSYIFILKGTELEIESLNAIVVENMRVRL